MKISKFEFFLLINLKFKKKFLIQFNFKSNYLLFHLTKYWLSFNQNRFFPIRLFLNFYFTQLTVYLIIINHRQYSKDFICHAEFLIRDLLFLISFAIKF